MRRRFRLFVLVPLLLLLVSCDDSPTSPESTGKIQLVIVDDTNTQDSEADSTSAVNKQTSTAALTELEVRVLTSNNTLVASQILFPVEGYFEGTIEVKAQNNLKVLCVGKNNGVVERFAMDPDVDVKAGQTATATIPETHWYASYIPIIKNITPNPSVDGSYNVSWNAVPNATMYVLEEADNVGLAGIGEVYSGAEPMRGFSGIIPGTYYYRVRATNAYGIASGWSEIQSVVVSAPTAVYTISGIVTGADSVTVTLSGDATGSLMVMDGGTYSFTVSSGSYMVNPSRTGYSFEPSSSSYSNLTSNQTQNYIGTPSATYTISGTVTGADGVLITLSGDDSGTTVVNSGESYHFIVTQGGTYTITPSRTDIKFTPSSITFRDVASDQTQDFVGERVTVMQFTLTISVNQTDWGTTNPSPGTYKYDSGTMVTITAFPAQGYAFLSWVGAASGQQTTIVIMDSDKTITANFTRIELFTITGNISGASEVTVTLSGDVSSDQTIVTDKGIYSFTVAHSGNYTVTPSKDGYTFTPASQTFTNVISHQTQNFVATQITYTISGTITGANSVTISLSGDMTDNQIVNNGESYSFTVNVGGNYIVTPLRNAFMFEPENQTFTNLSSNQIQDFVGSVISLGGKIAFQEMVLNDFEIMVINPDGTNIINLTDNKYIDQDMTWSPDGSQIVFATARDENYELYIMNADGSNQRRLTFDPAVDANPTWSPDGSRIAFRSTRNDNYDIYVINVDGSNEMRLTTDTASDHYPSWSPDGSKIAFKSDRDGNAEIYVINPDGSGLTRLTNNTVTDTEPSWSPDGSIIVFRSNIDENRGIYVMCPDGSHRTKIYESETFKRLPRWSPF